MNRPQLLGQPEPQGCNGSGRGCEEGKAGEGR